MRYGTKWFSSALAMAFVAIVALCVSPAFAWSCCCSAEQAVALSASSPVATVTSSAFSNSSTAKAEAPEHCARPCCDETGKKSSAQVKASSASAHQASAASAAHTSIVKKKCACAHEDGSAVVSAVPASHSFFGAGALALPVRAFALSFEEDARFAPCLHVAARPRSSQGRSSSGRGPPVFSS